MCPHVPSAPILTPCHIHTTHATLDTTTSPRFQVSALCAAIWRLIVFGAFTVDLRFFHRSRKDLSFRSANGRRIARPNDTRPTGARRANRCSTSVNLTGENKTLFSFFSGVRCEHRLNEGNPEAPIGVGCI